MQRTFSSMVLLLAINKPSLSLKLLLLYSIILRCSFPSAVLGGLGTAVVVSISMAQIARI
jgi:hypothetical protein